jgi:hypothetical protein
MEEAEATAVVGAIDAAHLQGEGYFDLSQYGFLDSFQSAISLELLEKTVFPFACHPYLKYRWRRITEGFFRFHDCLFLQHPQRPRRPPGGQRVGRPAPQCEANLWLSRLQRRVRPMRADHQDHH